MFTVITFEYETSQPQTLKNVDRVHAHKLGLNGGFYKVQIIDDNGIITYEYKGFPL